MTLAAYAAPDSMTTAAPPPVAGRDTPLTLAELIDLEAQLSADVEGEPRELVARDAAIGEAIGAARLAGRRHDLLRAWLGAVGASKSLYFNSYQFPYTLYYITSSLPLLTTPYIWEKATK